MSSSFQDLLEGRIDFEGQKSVENISKFALVIITVVSFIVGFVAQSLQLTFVVFGASTVALALAVVPPWPMFNQHPVKWATTIETKKSQ